MSMCGLGCIPVGVIYMLSFWFELRFGKKPLLLFGMMGVALFGVGVLVGVGAILWRYVIPEAWGGGVGYRPLLNLVETCVIVGSVMFVGGLLGEQIAGQRSELRELRRQLDEIRAGPAADDR